MLELSVRTRMDEGRRPHTRVLSVAKCDLYPHPHRYLSWAISSISVASFPRHAAFSSPVFS